MNEEIAEELYGFVCIDIERLLVSQGYGRPSVTYIGKGEIMVITDVPL